jgi:hypothetical protein
MGEMIMRYQVTVERVTVEQAKIEVTASDEDAAYEKALAVAEQQPGTLEWELQSDSLDWVDTVEDDLEEEDD